MVLKEDYLSQQDRKRPETYGQSTVKSLPSGVYSKVSSIFEFQCFAKKNASQKYTKGTCL